MGGKHSVLQKLHASDDFSVSAKSIKELRKKEKLFFKEK